MNLFARNIPEESFSFPLHAMRGIAALVVLLYHLRGRLVENSSLSFPEIFNGSAAVTFFFVLSGLVIGLSLSKTKLSVNSYIEYGMRRFFRIMPLMVVTVTLGGVYLLFIDPHMPVRFLPDEYGGLTPAKFVAAYIGYSLKPNPPIWSIFVELVASVALPFMVWTGQRKIYVFLMGTALLAFGVFNLGFHHHWNFYMIDFFLGVTILWWGKAFAAQVSKLSDPPFWAFVTFLFILFYLPRVFIAYQFGDPRFNLVEMVPVTLLVAIVFYCPNMFAGLKLGVFGFLGDISFSLYLTHTLVLALITNALIAFFPEISGHVALFAIVMAVISLPLCLYLATLSFRYIETPFIEYGKQAIKLYRDRRDRPALKV